MTHISVEADSVFDPAQPARSLDVIQAQFPVRRQEFKGTVIGDFVSRKKGEGYDPDGVRDYEPGDDMNGIDWPLTMASPDLWPQVRERYRDITPSMWIVSDVLQDRHKTNPGYYSERLLALSAVGALMRMAHVQGMPSLVLASGDRSLLINQKGPRRGRLHMLARAQALSSAIVRNEAEVNRTEDSYYLSDLLKHVGHKATKSVIAVVADFRDVKKPDDETQGWQEPLTTLTNKGNQVVAVELNNPWDFHLPDTATRLTGGQGVTWIGTDKVSRQQRLQYEAAAKEQQTAIDNALVVAKAHHIKLSTDDPRWRDSFRDQLRTAKSTKA